MKTLLLSLILSASLFAQATGTPVSVVAYPPETPTMFLDYAGGSNLTYICVASPINKTSTPGNYTYSLSVAGSTLTNIVVLTNVGTVTTVAAHGLMVGQTTTVSGSATTALNASYVVASTPSTTTFTIATSGVTNATYTTGLVLSGTVPLLTSPIWAIKKLTYDGSNNLTGTLCANGVCQAQTNICSNRTTISYK
jgi:FtsP/CotA-like multicopper oxidase with cupredoxin domain